MSDKQLLTGNEACAEGAIQADCRFYFGYPITPQNDLPEYMSRRLPEVGGTFIQAESELAAISMVHGTAAAGERAMTTSSSPGISLKQEGLSYLTGSELPAVVVNCQRAGPGLGDVRCGQGDYNQACHGGGHGDYHLIVLAPSSVQECADLTRDAFDLADYWRNPVLVLTDQQVGQMMEPVRFPPRDGPIRPLPAKDWALTGAAGGRPKRLVKSFFPIEGDLERFNWHLQAKYRRIEAEEVRFEEVQLDDAELILVAYGTSGRICKQVVKDGRAAGLAVGLLRPITVWPFPTERIGRLAEAGKTLLCVEMAYEQMTRDVRLAAGGRTQIHTHFRLGGGVPSVDDMLKQCRKILAGEPYAPAWQKIASEG
jgi:2-oxoglutarate ferredoxin oxidoreductase subunit alpha